MANNLGTTSDRWERQVEANASGVPQDLGKLRDTRAEGLDPLGELGRTMDPGRNPKGRVYQNIARPGGIDIMKGREEMSAMRTP